MIKSQVTLHICSRTTLEAPEKLIKANYYKHYRPPGTSRDMKILLTILLYIILNFNHSYAQGLGKWYIIKRPGIIEYTVTKDSNCSKELYHNFEAKESRKVKCTKIDLSGRDTIKLGTEVLVIYKSDKDSSLWTSMLIIESNKVYQLMSWTVSDTAMKSKNDLINFHKKESREHFGVYFFREQAIDSLKHLKNMSDMNHAEFIDLIKEYGRLNPSFIQAAMDMKVGLGVYFYTAQLVAGILLEKGYNPFFKFTTFEEFLDKYQNDPEIKKILKK